MNISGFVNAFAGLAADKPLDEILAEANRIASLVVGSKGAALPADA